jgi:bifunctional glutamyl/prolyl-tRNA synthetase
LKDKIDAEVKSLLELKAQYKTLTGKDWKPEPTVAPIITAKTEPVATNSSSDDSISDQIKKKGDEIRQLKSDKAPKVILFKY